MHAFLHAYGLAEVDFAVFIGERRGDTQLLYRPVASHVEYRIVDHELRLRVKGTETPWHCTGDFADDDACGLRISPGRRLSTDILSQLENWGAPEWARRTGYLARDGDGVIYQLRAVIDDPTSLPSDINYWEFCRRFRVSFLDKPNWS